MKYSMKKIVAVSCPGNRLCSYLHICLLTLIVMAPSSALAEQFIRYIDNELTLEVEDIPLGDVLQVIAAEGVSIHCDPAINPIITARFTNRKIETILPSLVKPYSYALGWKGDGGDERQFVLDEIRIFQPGKPPYPAKYAQTENLEIVVGEAGRPVVKNMVLLRLDPRSDPDEIMESLKREMGLEYVDFHQRLGVLRIQVPDGDSTTILIDEISNNYSFVTVEPEFAYSLDPFPQRPDFTKYSANTEPESQAGTQGTAIAVFDSGISTSLIQEPFVFNYYDALSDSNIASDNIGHGTQMALVASGEVSPMGISKSEILNPVVAVRAFDDNGFTSTFTLMKAVDFAVDSGAGIVSMSWGAETVSPLLKSTIDYAADNGLILLAAAGNQPTGTPVYPAAFDNVIGVGAVDPSGRTWKESNYGDFVSIQAPGFAKFTHDAEKNSDLYAGTSISTAYAANMLANLLSQKKNVTLDSIVEELYEELQMGSGQ